MTFDLHPTEPPRLPLTTLFARLTDRIVREWEPSDEDELDVVLWLDGYEIAA